MVSATRETSWRTPVSRSGVPSLPCRYLLAHDVGRGHRPVFGDFDVLLLEDDAALGVGDLGEAEFPLDFVVGRDAGLGEEAAEGEAGGLLLRERPETRRRETERRSWFRLSVLILASGGSPN